MTQRSEQRTHRRGTALVIIAEVIGMIMQLAVLSLGIFYLLGDDEIEVATYWLGVWCLLATVYLAGTVLWLNVDLRMRAGDPIMMRRISSIAPMRIFSLAVTFGSSIVGLAAAADLILIRNEELDETKQIFELFAVWAMLASWAMFHWGYSRIYYSHYHRSEAERPLRFPGTEQPRLLDFVYFAFTNGTSFAPSDVSVATTRMRWTVVWHTTFSFFFNALIIVLTMNTISGGFANL